MNPDARESSRTRSALADGSSHRIEPWPRAATNPPSIHHLLPRALCRGRPWSWSWRLAKQTPRPSRACAHVERVAEVRKPMARASPASILPCAPCCRPTVDLNEAIDASMDGALKVFDEMDTRYAFISLPFNIWLC